MIEIILLIILTSFAVPSFFGAPYVPTLGPYVPVAFDLLDLAPGQTILELGCGDGKVVLAAAKRGLNVVGYELNPILVVVAWLRTFRYRKQVTIVWGNFFTKSLPRADGIFCFIMPKFMGAIDKKISASQLAPIKLVSFAMPIPDRRVTKKKDNVLLYLYK